MKHPLTRIFTPISMIVMLAITSIAIGLEGSVESTDVVIESKSAGMEQGSMVSANQTGSQPR